MFLLLAAVLWVQQAAVPEFRPGKPLPDSPDDSAYAAAVYLKKTLDVEYAAKKPPTGRPHASSLRFISAYNLSSNGTRRKIGAKGAEVEQYSPLDDMVKILLYVVNLTNRINPQVTLTRVAPDLFAVYIDEAGWSEKAWEDMASKDVYWRQEWVQPAVWDYLTAWTYSAHPIMRADQFISLATVAPDYYELLGVPKTIQELQKLLGIDEKLLADTYRIKGSVKTDNLTVTLNNRILERRQGAFDIWSSNDVVNSKGKKNALRQLDVIGGDIHRLDIDGQEHFFELGNGLWGTYLNNAAGARVDEVPINIATDDNFRDHRVLACRSCIGCHELAIKSFQSDQGVLLEKEIFKLRTIEPQAKIALEGRYDEKAIQRFIRNDQENYRTVIEDLINETPEKISAMYANAWKVYNEQRVTLHQAALDTGLSDAALTAVIVPSIDPNLQYLIVAPGHTLDRGVWEDVVGFVFLLKGRPVPPKGRIQLPEVAADKLPKNFQKEEEIAIVGSVVLTAPKLIGEQQTAKVTIKTKSASVIKGYVKQEDRIAMRTSADSGTEHELDFTFTAKADGFPTLVKVEMGDGKFVDVPITVK